MFDEPNVNGEVLLFWNWEIEENIDAAITSNSDTEEVHSQDSEAVCSDTDESEECDVSIETVPFKCIGSDKERKYQKVLEEVSNRLENNIPVDVHLVPEPNNPFDNQAIKFVCNLDSEDHTIGYIVTECLADVHQAMALSLIVKVEFTWVKCRSYRGSLPRFYAAISITSKRGWSNTVKRSSSTFH